ncbi:hypothetical protein SELMODRAFT_266570 [Selaginella moellendorffii]|uniref:soluble epoxide hydrolase n=1 Tax=Selaginella moellendorffii TaxID=88036 RepID=D8QN21_SELML|nr:uncharacterized protein LOC9632502 isoform X1 [Selaginella moellendorffii]EFJ38029.1 hypothetical protein SELMODRAFT_266570 [Selaginella moellendorffii]|eukprot:XP_002960490.1 uncharacterized protein LOC9632502 isoform X1 [Selaginella moellendorffii]
MAEAIEHSVVETNGICIHVAQLGSGPAVLLLHGFPEIWYSWRYQMPALAAAGYRAIAPDLRGYGQSDAPLGIQHYTVFDVVGDLVGLLDFLQQDQAVLVGHDWGAIIAWNFCMLRPERVKGIVALSVPFSPRNPHISPVQRFEKLIGEGFYYCRFQEPGRAEADFARHGTKAVLKTLLGSSGRGMIAPKDKELFDIFRVPDKLPPWLTEEDIEYYALQFEKSGFTPPLNYYRATDLSWRLSSPWTGARIQTPAIFITGDKDVVYGFPGTKEFIHSDKFRKFVPNLRGVTVVPGAGHFIQQQKHAEVNELILRFLASILPSRL